MLFCRVLFVDIPCWDANHDFVWCPSKNISVLSRSLVHARGGLCIKRSLLGAGWTGHNVRGGMTLHGCTSPPPIPMVIMLAPCYLSPPFVSIIITALLCTAPPGRVPLVARSGRYLVNSWPLSTGGLFAVAHHRPNRFIYYSFYGKS